MHLFHNQHHSLYLREYVHHTWDLVMRSFEKMPLAQGSIISVVFGITVGSVFLENIDAAVFVTTWLAAGMSVVLGTITIWLLNFEPRHEKFAITGGIIMLMVMSMVQLFIGDPMVVSLVRNLSIITLIYTIFMMGVHGYSRRKDRIANKDCDCK